MRVLFGADVIRILHRENAKERNGEIRKRSLSRFRSRLLRWLAVEVRRVPRCFGISALCILTGLILLKSRNIGKLGDI
ncbi:MAG: hypothetical protein A2Z18_08365 [Armatimonadetes bacterium RBG_16_58_9]|nr:MAG: hypothetical protein A2Z18_08365 [Armatimonadetes bacterium RBG_16_58_9]